MDASLTARWSQRRRLGTVLGLNLSLIGALVVAGLAANSVGVLAAAGDTAADSVALVLGLIAVALRDRDPDHPHAHRPIAVVALVNGVALLVVTGVVAVESVRRLRGEMPVVHGIPMTVVSVVTMLVLLVGAWILGLGSADEDVHMRSVLLDTLADAAAAGAVAVAGAVIAITGRFSWLDPVLALVISAVVAVAGVHLLTKAVAPLRGAHVDFDDD